MLIDNKPWDFVGALKRTRELIAEGGHEVLFEAAFEYKGCFARVDILQFDRTTGRWTVIEVKSATKVKPEYLDDVGLQIFVLANSGLPIERVCLWHLSSECRAPDLKNLFREVDVTADLRTRHPSIAPKLNEIFGAIRRPEIPAVDIGPHCSAREGDCQFKAHCFAEKGVPALSVFNIPAIKEKAWEYYAQGKLELRDIDPAELNETQQRMVRATLNGKREVNVEALLQAIHEWKFPLVFLDFETINPALPRYTRARGHGSKCPSNSAFAFGPQSTASWNIASFFILAPATRAQVCLRPCCQRVKARARSSATMRALRAMCSPLSPNFRRRTPPRLNSCARAWSIRCR